MILSKQEAICLILHLANKPLTEDQIKSGLIILDKHMIPSEYSGFWLEKEEVLDMPVSTS